MILFFQGLAIAIWLCISCFVTCLLVPFQYFGFDGTVFLGKMFRLLACPLSGIQVKVEGMELLKEQKPRVIVANHQHSLDLAIFAWATPRKVIMIGKFEVLFIPFFGIMYWALGHVLIHRKNRVQSISGLDQAAENMMSRNASVWVFPEGTRNKSLNGFLPFKKGAFYLAAKAGVPIYPIVVSSLRPLIPQGWSRIKRGIVYVKVLPPIATTGIDYKNKIQVEALLEKTRAVMLDAYGKLHTKVLS